MVSDGASARIQDATRLMERRIADLLAKNEVLQEELERNEKYGRSQQQQITDMTREMEAQAQLAKKINNAG